MDLILVMLLAGAELVADLVASGQSVVGPLIMQLLLVEQVLMASHTVTQVRQPVGMVEADRLVVVADMMMITVVTRAPHKVAAVELLFPVSVVSVPAHSFMVAAAVEMLQDKMAITYQMKDLPVEEAAGVQPEEMLMTQTAGLVVLGVLQ